MIKTAAVAELKAHLSRLLRRVKAGDEILVTERGVPVARIVPVPPVGDERLREAAARSRSVRAEHEDPADRFLAATADVYELTLVTADERLLRGKGFRTLANR